MFSCTWFVFNVQNVLRGTLVQSYCTSYHMMALVSNGNGDHVVFHSKISQCHFVLLPPAYVVRREVNVLTRVCAGICLSTGGGGTHIP